jgi:acetyl esterase/lipase
MPSYQAKFFNKAVRLLVKRKRWGRDERALAARARRVFGAPRFWQWITARGVAIEPVRVEGIRGEWIRPPGSIDDAAILYIHGGGFVSCSPRTHRPITAALSRRTGLPVFAVDYRLAPECPFPAAIDDGLDAYEWLIGNGISRIALAGDSAGGGLVLSLLLRIRASGSPMPACGVCFSPWNDLSGSSPSIKANADACHTFYPENINEFAAAYLNGADPRSPSASPFFADVSGLPPVLFQVSSVEILLDDSRLVYEKMLAAGIDSRIEIYDDLLHCWQMLHGLVPEAGAALANAAAFITRHIGGHR